MGSVPPFQKIFGVEGEFNLTNCSNHKKSISYYAAEGPATASKYSLEVEDSGGDSAEKSLTITGGGFSNAQFQKLEEGFSLTFYGDWEFEELLNFFDYVKASRG